jgi:Tfp pilus assembly protein PilV
MKALSMSRPGFTMLESLFALLVILMGFFAAITMNSAALRSGTINETQFQAVFLADSKIEEIRSYMPTFTGASLTVSEFFDRNGLLVSQDKAFFTRETVITVKTPSANTDEVRVTVKAKNSPLTISYVSVIDHLEDKA